MQNGIKKERERDSHGRLGGDQWWEGFGFWVWREAAQREREREYVTILVF